MKKVSHVQLHDGFFLPNGGGQIGNTLPPVNKTLPNLEMFLLDSGQVQMEWGNSVPSKSRYVIGAANVKGALLAPPEEPKAVKAKA